MSINNGEKFHPRFDARHNLNVVATYSISDRLTASAAFVFNSGNVLSLPNSWIYFNNYGYQDAFVIPNYESRNNFRAPSYNRLDVGLVWKFNPKWGKSDLTFSVYNVYNRLNPFIITITQDFGDASDDLDIPAGAKVEQISLFPVIPAVTYNFSF